MWTAGTIPKNIKRAQSMSRTLRSNNSEFRKEQIGLDTSVERPAFSNPPLNEAAVMPRAPPPPPPNPHLFTATAVDRPTSTSRPAPDTALDPHAVRLYSTLGGTSG